MDLRNHHRVSNLSFLSKMLEKIVSKQLIAYFESNCLLPTNQYAYRVNYSTETALLRVYSDLVAASDAGQVSLLMLLDLSAAFDTVDHDILLRRLSSDFGLFRTAILWFSSYLSNRKQSV